MKQCLVHNVLNTWFVPNEQVLKLNFKAYAPKCGFFSIQNGKHQLIVICILKQFSLIATIQNCFKGMHTHTMYLVKVYLI